MNRMTITAMVMIAMVGCATQKISFNMARPIDLGRVFSRDVTTPDPLKVRTVIVRDSGFSGSGCNIKISVDGRDIADMKPEERIELYLSPGEHIMEIRTNGGLCGHKSAGVAIHSTSGVVSAFRVGYPASGDITITPTTL